jgi:hypothetical protein
VPEYHEPLWTDPRSYESTDGDILPLELMVDPVQPRPDVTEYPMVHVPDSELEGPTQRTLRKALAEQALHAASETATKEKEALQNENLDPATAMRLLHKAVGFYARDSREQSSIQAIVDRSGASKYPTLRYLYDVQYHHISLETKDPSAAPKSIVRSFEQYAVQADREARFTRFFSKTIHGDRKASPDQTITDIMTAEEYSNDAQTRRTLTSVVRLIEADRFAEEGEGKYPLAVRHGVDSRKGNARDAYVLSLIDALPLRDVMRYNERLRVEENNRFEYWRSQLAVATMFSPVRAQAYESLAKLDTVRPQSASQ